MDTRPMEIVCQGIIDKVERNLYLLHHDFVRYLRVPFSPDRALGGRRTRGRRRQLAVPVDLPGLSDSEHSDDDSSDDEEGDVGVDKCEC